MVDNIGKYIHFPHCPVVVAGYTGIRSIPPSGMEKVFKSGMSSTAPTDSSKGSYLTIHKQFPHFVLEAIILLPLFLSTPCEVMLNSLSYHFGLPQIPSFIIAVQLRVVWVGFIALCSPNIPWASKYSPYSMLHSTRVVSLFASFNC